jgi:hypothetical protein
VHRLPHAFCEALYHRPKPFGAFVIASKPHRYTPSRVGRQRFDGTNPFEHEEETECNKGSPTCGGDPSLEGTGSNVEWLSRAMERGREEQGFS